MGLAISFGVIDFLLSEDESIFEEASVEPDLHDGSFAVKYFYFCVALDSDIRGGDDNGLCFGGFVFGDVGFDRGRPFDGVPDPFLGAVAIIGELNAGFEDAAQLGVGAELDGGDLALDSGGHAATLADLLKIAHVAALAGDGDALLVVGAHGTVEGHGVEGFGEMSDVHHVGADDDSRSAFAGLAVDGGAVAGISAEIVVDVAAHRDQQLQGRRVVIVKGILDHVAVELGRVVVSLTAQVVEPVVAWVAGVQKPLGVDPRVAV